MYAYDIVVPTILHCYFFSLADHSVDTAKMSASKERVSLKETSQLNGAGSQSTDCITDVPHIPTAVGQTSSKQLVHCNTKPSLQFVGAVQSEGSADSHESNVPAWKVDLLKRKKEAARVYT